MEEIFLVDKNDNEVLFYVETEYDYETYQTKVKIISAHLDEDYLTPDELNDMFGSMKTILKKLKEELCVN